MPLCVRARRICDGNELRFWFIISIFISLLHTYCERIYVTEISKRRIKCTGDRLAHCTALYTHKHTHFPPNPCHSFSALRYTCEHLFFCFFLCGYLLRSNFNVLSFLSFFCLHTKKKTHCAVILHRGANWKVLTLSLIICFQFRSANIRYVFWMWSDWNTIEIFFECFCSIFAVDARYACKMAPTTKNNI